MINRILLRHHYSIGGNRSLLRPRRDILNRTCICRRDTMDLMFLYWICVFGWCCVCVCSLRQLGKAGVVGVWKGELARWAWQRSCSAVNWPNVGIWIWERLAGTRSESRSSCRLTIQLLPLTWCTYVWGGPIAKCCLQNPLRFLAVSTMILINAWIMPAAMPISALTFDDEQAPERWEQTLRIAHNTPKTWEISVLSRALRRLTSSYELTRCLIVAQRASSPSLPLQTWRTRCSRL